MNTGTNSKLWRLPAFLAMFAGAAFGQFTAGSASAPPPGIPPSVSALLQKDGTRISGPSGPVCELWLAAAEPTGPKSNEENLTLPEIPHGSLLGVLRVPSTLPDRRNQNIKPGIYTLRYSYYPVNGAHQGVAPQRDFLVLTLAGNDTDGKAAPDFATLIAAGRKSSGSNHPNVLSFWRVDSGDFAAGLAKQGDHDWVLQTKLGAVPVAIILMGQAE